MRHHIPIKNNQDQTKKNVRAKEAFHTHKQPILIIYPFQHEFTFYFHIYEERIKIIYAVFSRCLNGDCVSVCVCAFLFEAHIISLYVCRLYLYVPECIQFFVYHLFFLFRLYLVDMIVSVLVCVYTAHILYL